MANKPCPCGNSSDAYEPYPNGGFCFSCNKKFRNNKETNVLEDISNETSLQYIPYRGHACATLEFYKVKVEVTEDEVPLSVIYPYPSNWEKHRSLSHKRFWSTGTSIPELFGQDRFSAGSALAITITEGEEDTLAAFEMLGSKYPVVSVRSATSAAKDCASQKEYLNSFEKIYLCFDNDEPGKQAINQVSALFPFNKIYIVKLTKHKDANDYLLAGDNDEFKRCWFNARRHDPENIVSAFTEVEKKLLAPKKKSICSFPFSGLQEATFGIRTGETYLFKALEGIGKTEVMGAIEYHVIKETDYSVGIIHLEEDVQRSAQRLVNYYLEVPVHLEGINDVSQEQVYTAYKELCKRDNRVHFYEQGRNDSDIDSVLAGIRFLVASCECKVVFLDHISRMVSGTKVDNERIELDRIATNLSKLALELDFALIMVTHVNDDGLTRGSRNISKEAWTVISLERDKMNPDEGVRNTTNFLVEKNRHASITGPAGSIYFNPLTFTLSDTPTFVLPEV